MSKLNVLHWSIVGFCIILILQINGEWHIKETSDPSILFHKFDNIEEDVFPNDIRIRFSLTRIAGTLLYSIDRHLNQLIMTLQDGISSNLIIEFKKQTLYVKLQELCHCTECRYQKLDLRIQIGKVINLQCNNNIAQELPYTKTDQLNRDYPIPYPTNHSRLTSNNDAYLWLVNTPQYGKANPNYDQMSGCIFDVSYNDQLIRFNKSSEHIEEICHRTCDNNICNGGVCQETYEVSPVCDCTMTFLNGQFCNASISQKNLRSVSPFFVFNMLKVSWKSDEQELLILKNKIVQIRLYRIESTLFIEFNYENGVKGYLKKALTESYIPNMKYILIVSFTEDKANMEFYDNGKWRKVVTPTIRNLNIERFESLTLRSGDGVLDLVYKKYSLGNRWRKVMVYEYEEIETDASLRRKNNINTHNPIILNINTYNVLNPNENPNKNKIESPNLIVVILSTIIILGILAVAIYMMFKMRKKIFRIRRRIHKGENNKRSRNRNEPEYEGVEPVYFYSNNSVSELFLANDKERMEDNKVTGIVWINYEVGHIPPNPIEAAEGVYIIQAEINKELLIGTVKSGQIKGSVPWNTREVTVQEFKVLCYTGFESSDHRITWIEASKGRVPEAAVQCGTNWDTKPIFVARSKINEEMCVGNVDHHYRCTYMAHDGLEHKIHQYEVLCAE